MTTPSVGSYHLDFYGVRWYHDGAGRWFYEYGGRWVSTGPPPPGLLVGPAMPPETQALPPFGPTGWPVVSPSPWGLPASSSQAGSPRARRTWPWVTGALIALVIVFA